MLYYKTISLFYCGREVKSILKDKGYTVVYLNSLLKELGYSKPYLLVDPYLSKTSPEQVKKTHWILSLELAYKTDDDKKELKLNLLECIKCLLRSTDDSIDESSVFYRYRSRLNKSYLHSYVSKWFIETILDKLIKETLKASNLL